MQIKKNHRRAVATIKAIDAVTNRVWDNLLSDYDEDDVRRMIVDLTALRAHAEHMEAILRATMEQREFTDED